MVDVSWRDFSKFRVWPNRFDANRDTNVQDHIYYRASIASRPGKTDIVQQALSSATCELLIIAAEVQNRIFHNPLMSQ